MIADPRAHYGREVVMPGGDLPRRRCGRSRARRAADAVVDLSGDPVLDAEARFALAAVALDAGLEYRAPGHACSRPPPRRRSTGAVPVVAVIGTGKRTGKTALGTHLAALLREAGRATRWSSRWGGAGRPSRSSCARRSVPA